MTAARQLEEMLEETLGSAVTRKDVIGGGNTTTIHRLLLDDGRALILKQGRAGDKLDTEGWMLEYLAAHSDLPVPKVYHAAPDMLVMDEIPTQGRPDDAAQEHAAELLAALHGVTADQYGLERDTLIGPLDQPNTPGDDWIAFFAERRIGHMARKALEEGRIDRTLMRGIETLIARLDRLMGAPAPPSLIHGDVWQGNVLAGAGRINGFIDPAIYYADPEIELAFSTLFGTFADPFFRRYHELRPIRDGFFEARRDLYNLYPLLVHVRLFGAGYAGQVRRIVDRFS